MADVPLSRPSTRAGWRWRVKPWRSKNPTWGIEIKRRQMLKHSQIRVHLGRRHLTLMAYYVGGGPS